MRRVVRELENLLLACKEERLPAEEFLQVRDHIDGVLDGLQHKSVLLVEDWDVFDFGLAYFDAGADFDEDLY